MTIRGSNISYQGRSHSTRVADDELRSVGRVSLFGIPYPLVSSL